MDPAEIQELVGNLGKASRAIDRLARNDTYFRAAVDAFSAGNGESFQRLLQQLEIGLDCDLVCNWICSKECIRVCLEMCGPPREALKEEELPQFAEAVAKITGDEQLVRRLAESIDQRDRAAFQALVSELQIERFCHVLCHWACGVRCRLRCEVVCSPVRVPIRRFVTQLSIAGAAIRQLAANGPALERVSKAAAAFNCEELSGLIGGIDGCVYLCEWICSWRCVLICLPLCRAFPLPEDLSIDEMRAFAQVCGRLVAEPNAYGRLVQAMDAGDAEAFGAVIKELQLERFCLQLCHWLCSERCRLYCRCVCPPPATIPLFTKVGQYRVDPIWNDFTADGTTTAGGLAFTDTIPLIGLLPDGTAPDAIEYRFRTEKYPIPSGAQDVIAGMIKPTVIGQLEYWWYGGPGPGWSIAAADYYVNNPGATVTIPQPGPPLTVPVNKDVKPGGWIEVPRENQLFVGGVGRFVPTGGLANLDTTTLTDEHFDLSVAVPPLPLQAGDAMPATQRSEKPHFKIYFEARKVMGLAAVNSNDLPKIALSNTAFTYNRHPDWDGGVVTTELVLSLDIEELRTGGGCNPLSDHVHALFTAYHPYLASCEVSFQGPAPLPAPINPPISADGVAVSPAGGQDFDISTLKPCAYIVWLEATLNLTAGYGAIFGTFQDEIAFCKH